MGVSALHGEAFAVLHRANCVRAMTIVFVRYANELGC